MLARTLPGILESGLWRALDALPSAPARALVTDVGNDILYGSRAPQILAWVEQCLERLLRHTRDVVLTGLPLARIRRLGPRQYLVFRSLLFPSCRVTLADALATAEEVGAGLASLARAKEVRLLELRPEWYGLDPIHIRPRHWRRAWQEILCGAQAAVGDGRRDSLREWAELYLLRPERQWLFGREQRTPQSGQTLARGGRLWLY